MDYTDAGMEPAVLPAGVLAALTHIDGVGFPGIATTLAGVGPKINRNWVMLIRNSSIAVAVTAWPGDLRPAVERFTDAAEKMVAVLEQNDMTAVVEAANELHIAYRALSDAGWAELARTAGMPTP